MSGISSGYVLSGLIKGTTYYFWLVSKGSYGGNNYCCLSAGQTYTPAQYATNVGMAAHGNCLIASTSFFSSGWENGSGILDSLWTAEGETAGSLSVVASSGSVTPPQGSYFLKSFSSSAAMDYIYRAFSNSGTIGVRVFVCIHSAPAHDIAILNLDDYPSTKSLAILFVPAGTHSLRVYNWNNDSAIGSDFVMSYDTWYQVEILFIAGTSIAWRVWNASGQTLVQAEQKTTTSISATQCGSVYLGNTSDTYGEAAELFDSLVIDNTNYPGPLITVTSFYPFPSFKPSY